jgi:hypothetical protein
MDLTLYFLASEPDKRLARVEGLASYARKPLPVFTHGDRVNLTIYLVDGSGGYHPDSGSGVLSKRLALGQRGANAIAYTTSFTSIDNGWTCALDLTTHELAVFLANNGGPLALEFSTTAAGPAKTVWASPTAAVMGAVSDPAAGSAIVPPAYYTAAEIDALFQPAADTYLFPSLMYFGAATVDQVFDYFKARAAVSIIGVQIGAQSIPTGADLTLCLVNSAAAEIAGSTVTLTAGTAYGETIFGSPITLAAGSFVRAKIKTKGSTQPGGYLNLKLILRPIIS